MKNLFVVGLSAVAVVALTGSQASCDVPPSADTRERQATQQMANQAAASVGMPSITRFAAKRTMKMVYELQDQQQPTTTYVFSQFTGKLYKLCDSLGYPIPYATQYTNPQREGMNMHGAFTLPQPDPDGLFKPGAADGTWVVCVGAEKKAVAVYVEDRVIASPMALKPLEEVK